MKSTRQALQDIGKTEFVSKGMGFQGFTPSAFFDSQNLQPTIWEQRARQFQERNLELSNRVETFNLVGEKERVITIQEEPKALKQTAEDVIAHKREISTRQITIDAEEFTGRYTTNRQSMRRTFIPTMEMFSRELGYSAQRAIDENLAQTVYDAADANEITTLFAGGKADRPSLADGDKLSLDLFRKVNSMTKRRRYKPSSAFISPEAEMQLLAESNLSDANRYGGTEVIRDGAVARLYGIDVFVVHSVYLADQGTDTVVSKNIFVGETNRGEQALAYAKYSDLIIEQDYKPQYRKFELIGHMDFGHEIIHPNAVFVVETHNGEPYTGDEEVAGSEFA